MLIQVTASKQVSPKYVSMAIGFISVFYAIGQMVGPGIVGWIIEKVSFVAAYGLGALDLYWVAFEKRRSYRFGICEIVNIMCCVIINLRIPVIMGN